MRWIPLVALACLGAVLPALSALGAAAQGPPTRFYGRVSVNGEPTAVGTTVEGYVDGTLCGEGTVRDIPGFGIGYVVDVLSESFRPGCGTDGEAVRFKVGGLDANETGEFRTGSFAQVDLTVSGQVAPPTSTPPPGSPAPSGTASPSPAASPTPGSSPTPGTSPTPQVSPSPEASPSPSPEASPSPTGSPEASPAPTATPAAASPTPSGAPTASPISARADPTDDDGDGLSPAVWALPLIVLLAGAGAGLYVYQRRRGGG
jgi:hypothetical protein